MRNRTRMIAAGAAVTAAVAAGSGATRSRRRWPGRCTSAPRRSPRRSHRCSRPDTHDGTAEAIPLERGVTFRLSLPDIVVDPAAADQPAVRSAG
jgi:hypothetical protein